MAAPLSRPLLLMKPSTPFLCNSIKIKRYNNKGSSSRSTEDHEDHGLVIEQERASSTAEQFRRVAEKKGKANNDEETVHVADQGIDSQASSDKAFGGTKSGDGDVESLKQKYKKNESSADYRRTGG